MNKLALTDVIANLRDLPSLPLVVMEVLRSFENKDVSVGALANKVAEDQALTAKTLRLANSSFYGLPRKVTTIHQAIAILGFDSIRALVAAAAVTDRFSGSESAGADFNAFWRHAIGTALCAKLLARQLKANQEYAFVAGLLHDIGKLVLAVRFPRQFAAAISHRATHDCHVLDAERAVLGLDHAAVGSALAEYWKFPLVMQKTIANHHDPDDKDLDNISAIVHVADAIAHALDLSGQQDDLVPALKESAWNSVQVEPAVFRKICRDTEFEFERTCRILCG